MLYHFDLKDDDWRQSHNESLFQLTMQQQLAYDLQHGSYSRSYYVLSNIFWPDNGIHPLIGQVAGPIIESFMGEQFPGPFLNECIFGNYIPDIVIQFLGRPLTELDEEINMIQNPLKLCFRCGYITNAGIIFSAIEGSKNNGVTTLPKSSSIEDPCPFCGSELHQNPREFQFRYKCPFKFKDGSYCNKLCDFHTAMKHIPSHGFANEIIAEKILDQYHDRYEEWRQETNSDAPILQRFEKCAKCEKQSERKTMLRCLGCPMFESAWYCGTECQKQDWRIHRQKCWRLDRDKKDSEQVDSKPTGECIVIKCGKCKRTMQLDQALRCRGCDPVKSTYYCSNRCYKKNWKKHKRVCARLDKKQSAV